jgi:hypothetical protein
MVKICITNIYTYFKIWKKKENKVMVTKQKNNDPL